MAFTSNRKDQADRFIHARDGVADFVGTKHGMEHEMLVKHGEVKAFTEPKTPALGASPGELEKYKMELKLFKDEKKEWDTNLGIIFLHIRGQCSTSVLSKLESDEEYAKLEKNRDIVGLLKKLKTMAFLTGGVQDPFWALQNVLKRLVGINQGKEEMVDNYKKRFLAMTQVLKQQWGKFVQQNLPKMRQKKLRR